MEIFKTICKNNISRSRNGYIEIIHKHLIIGQEYKFERKTRSFDDTNTYYMLNENNEKFIRISANIGIRYDFYDSKTNPNRFMQESIFSNFFCTKEEMLKLKIKTILK